MKKDKTGVWQGTLSTTILLLTVVAFSSCTKEPIEQSLPGVNRMQVQVTFPKSKATKAITEGTATGTDDENRLDRVTILVFSGDGSQLETVLSENVTSSNPSLPTTQPKWATDQTLIVSGVISPDSPKKIYVLANWRKIDFDLATYTEAMLKDEITTITAVSRINGSAAYPILMSGNKEIPNLTSLSYKVTVDMERQVSKLKALITVPIDVQNYSHQIEWQTELMKITVANVPNKSYVVGRKASPAGITMLNSDPMDMDTKPNPSDQQVPATKDLEWGKSVYITENPITGTTQTSKDASTYIIVQLPYKNRNTGVIEHDNYYKVYINDTRDATSPYKVLRNTIYTLNIRILGQGVPINNLISDVNIDDQVTVNSWEIGEMGDVGDVVQTNDYFNIDRTQLLLMSVTELQSTISTNMLNWKLVKQGGTTIFSIAEGKTQPMVIDQITYTLLGNASSATIGVRKAAFVGDFPTQNMFFLAKNIKIPFVVAYKHYDRGSFIPNSVLRQDFTVEGILYNGWPAGKLPLNGLQVAKRGNVLPSGNLLAEDPEIKWSGVRENSGVTTLRPLSSGKGNYAQLNTLDATNYPIGQSCNHLGPEWYVPSIDELMLIYHNKDTFDADYALPLNSYWSTTEDNARDSWYMNFAPGSWGVGTSDKTAKYRVRCVREI